MKNSLVLFISLLFSLMNVQGQPSGFKALTDLSDLKTKMKVIGEQQKTIQSSFTQVKRMEYLDIAIESTGDFWYAQPDRVRWEYTSPYDYIIIINKGTLSLISGSNKNEFNLENSDAFEQINTLMMGSVTGQIFESQDYSIQAFESEKQYLISVEPIAEMMKGVLKKIDLFIDKNEGVVQKIIMTESETSYTKISFSNIKTNEAIAEKVFLP